MSPPRFVVGVGASAGGLEALEELFGAMPVDSGMAFIVIQHLSPDFRSMMDEILGRRTKMPVTLVEDGVQIEANHIYLIPSKKEMIVSGGRLLLSEKGTRSELTLPIDIFFRSLARERGPESIGVILSGAGSDGARGIRDIHDAGGLVVSQDEASAAFDGMPRSARETNIVDHVGRPSAIAAYLVEHIHGVATGVAAVGEVPGPLRGLSGVFDVLNDGYGIDFASYKPNTVNRRIDRRLHLTGAVDLDQYVQTLAARPDELDALYRDLLIGVTRFFRDPEAFDVIEQELVSDILERCVTDEIRLWVPACATGEEAYSFAILFHEALARSGDTRKLKVFATDVHPGSLEIANRGVYAAEQAINVNEARLERYFERVGETVQIVPELRQLIVFARHNVIRDAPFTRLDLVSCRNFLIYLQQPAQRKAIGLFHFALKNQGVLVLGPSESTGGLTDDFEAVSAQWRIYRKHRERRLRIDPPTSIVRTPEVRGLPQTMAGGSYSLAQTMSVYDAVLDEYMPPSMLVNGRREIVHTFHGASRYLHIRDGRPSLDVLEAVGSDLRMVLTGALRRVLDQGTAVVYKGLQLEVDGQKRPHRITLRPIATRSAPGPHVLICLEPSGPETVPLATENEMDHDEVSREQLSGLETELRYTKENLQATIAELESSNEELQSANEELIAANEELQSTNEELQSVNEELYTVNAEYQKKIAQLTELTNDMDNLLQSTDVGTLFLDRQLCIRKLTPRIHQTFNLLARDIGRPMSAFTSTLDHPGLMEDVESVLSTERPIEREVRDRAGNWYFLRVLPYRAAGGDVAQGVVLTVLDINGLKAAEGALFRERYLLDSLMASVPDAIYFRDVRGRYIRINRAMATRFDLSDPAEAVGKHPNDFVSEQIAHLLSQPDERALGGEEQPYRLEQHALPNGEQRWFTMTRQPLRGPDGKVVGMFGVARDVTEQKLAEDEIRQAVVRRDQFLAMLSHELRNPLGAIATAARVLLRKTEGPTPHELSVIDRQSRQMARLLDDLLEANRITHKKIELERRVVDLRPILDEAVAVIGPALAAPHRTLEIEADARPVLVLADASRMQQVIVNLLNNAAKYTNPGGHVRVSVTTENDEAVITVADDGVGMGPELINSVFELFVQGTLSLARTEGGMGVGLALVRTLVEMHGGTVSANSEGTGRGSQFVVRLPSIKRDVSTSSPRAAPDVPSKGPLRIVVVDDNEDSCQMLEVLLVSFGHVVETAYDGASGLELIRKAQPHVAILDIGLPVLTGYEVAERARAEDASLFLVALTGYGSSSDRERALAAGFDAHVVKPLRSEELHRVFADRFGIEANEHA